MSESQTKSQEAAEKYSRVILGLHNSASIVTGEAHDYLFILDFDERSRHEEGPSVGWAVSVEADADEIFKERKPRTDNIQGMLKNHGYLLKVMGLHLMARGLVNPDTGKSLEQSFDDGDVELVATLSKDGDVWIKPGFAVDSTEEG
jgi:hypothetical protein